jgi:hypothetical protein
MHVFACTVVVWLFGPGMSFELMMKRYQSGELGVGTTAHYRLLISLARNGPLFIRLGGLRSWVEKVTKVRPVRVGVAVTPLCWAFTDYCGGRCRCFGGWHTVSLFGETVAG